MTTFDEREKAFENKFQHDQELLFRVRARHGKLAGLWAAGLMGLSGDEAAAYALAIVDSEFGAAGTTGLRDRLVADLMAKGVDVSAHRVDKELNQLLTTAREQIQNS